MIIETLGELAPALSRMRAGERLNIARVSFGSFWPRPPYPRQDDYLTDEVRAKNWCARFGCNVWEQIDPPALVFHKITNQ